jgi:hypothetical protein
VLVQSFIDTKSSQLVYYVHAYWDDKLPYKEFENFMWDTLEEWAQIKHTQSQLYSHKERVFWHLLHETQFVSASALKSDDILKNQVEFCLAFLQNNRACPIDVVGMRP